MGKRLRLAVQYIRQSTSEQVKHNLQSKIQQDEMLSRRLISMGLTVELIRKIDADQGKSGQKLRMQRKGLVDLYQLIESGEAGAVAAYDASRLWRDTLHADKAAIEARAQHVDTEREDLTELQSLLDRVMHEWDGLTFERANIREETPHIIRIDVALKEPIKRNLIGYMFRHRGSKPKWTPEEAVV